MKGFILKSETPDSLNYLSPKMLGVRLIVLRKEIFFLEKWTRHWGKTEDNIWRSSMKSISQPALCTCRELLASFFTILLSNRSRYLFK